MKPEEALKYLKDFIDNEEPQIGAYNTEVLKKAIDALEKQIIKKPDYDGHTFACPTCKTIFLFKTGEVRGLRCKWCGQAIDWRRTNNVNS